MFKNARYFAILAFAAGACVTSFSAEAAEDKKARCAAVYEKYPIESNCRQKAYCLEQNVKNRQSRAAEGCGPKA